MAETNERYMRRACAECTAANDARDYANEAVENAALAEKHRASAEKAWALVRALGRVLVAEGHVDCTLCPFLGAGDPAVDPSAKRLAECEALILRLQEEVDAGKELVVDYSYMEPASRKDQSDGRR